MIILDEILKWSAGLPSWQSDAVARLLGSPTLSGDDLDHLLAVLKSAHGIPDSKNRVPVPLSADRIPVRSATDSHVRIHSVKGLKNVNAIAEDSILSFGKDGLTIIYGDNGSGKSGFSRVLKKACRARDQSEPILPNANLAAADVGNAEAQFDLSIDGIDCTASWVNGFSAPVELSSLAIFDSRCARAYLDNEDDFSFVPYGLDVFEALAKVCSQLKGLIETEYAQTSVDLTAFALLHGDTQVGKAIISLSARTKPELIEELAKLTPENTTRHADLAKSLQENNPKEKAAQLRLRSKRFAAIAAAAAAKSEIVSPAAVAKLRTLADEFRVAKAASELAAREFKESENLLPGTGGEVWRELFEAARKFWLLSESEKQFPDLGVESPCPLCQEPLEGGAQRLLRFEAFIQQTAEKTTAEKRRVLAAAYKPFAAQVFGLGLDDASFDEMQLHDAQLAIDTRAFENALAARHEAIKAAIVAHDWIGIDHPLADPGERLTALLTKLAEEAEVLEKASNEDARVALQKEFAELDARVRLNRVKDSVIAAIEKLNHQAKLKQCLSALKTNAISLKAAELTEKAVSVELESALNKEFQALGAGTLKVAIQSRSGKGKPLHKLKLQLPQSRNPGEILSEGEQRAIALGSFLAEVELSGTKGGIIFDDPVSSLDHRRRERVASRLAVEGKKRQVIIFTHDIYFLCLLIEHANAVGVSIVTQSLVRRKEGFGIVDPELPFEGKNTSRRIGALKAHQQHVAKLRRDGEDQKHHAQTVLAYNALRLTWERAVEEVLLRGVVLRFRKGVETQRLSGLSVEDEDFSAVHAGMTKCSNYAHDKAVMGGVAVPEPDELLQDIEALDTWRAKIEERAKDTGRRRKG